MSPEDSYPQAGESPPAVLAESFQWLLQHTVEALLGYALGLIAARVLRSCRLHWTWALAPMPLLAFIYPDLGAVAFTGACALVGAARSGRRLHALDVRTGGDLGAMADDRRTPVDVLRRAGAAALARWERSRGVAPGYHRGRLMIGRDSRGRAVTVPFGAGSGGRHAMVVGATGSGKTVTQTSLAVSEIQRGCGAVVIDPKGDAGMFSAIRRAADEHGRRFVLWTPTGGSVYNPFGRGTDTEIADKALAGERFTEPHYLRQAQRYLGHVVRGLRASGAQVSLRALVEHLDPDRLEVLSRTLPPARAGSTQDYLDSLTVRQRADLAGVRDRLAILSESDVGAWLDPAAGEGPGFDLLEEIVSRSVVYFSLEADSRPLLASMLAAAIVQDLQSAVAALQARPVASVVVIDEFSAIATEQVVRLFGRARSAGFSLLLATQEISDLRIPGREALLEQVMGNLSLLIAHRQVVPASAELIASVAGSRGAWRVSHRSDGTTTSTRTREAVLDGDEVMALARGWAAVITPGGRERARVARIIPPQARAGERRS
jgi:hypothetical protein